MKSVLKFLALGFAAVAFPALAAAPAGDPVAGKKAFIQCQACHTVQAAGTQRLGPTMQGIYGAKIASRPGYAYSAALKGVSGKWDDAMLDNWLKRPSNVAQGTKMAFAGVADPKRRSDLTAYLKTLK